MTKVCKWCYRQPLERKIENQWISRWSRTIDVEALDWLGIKENDICHSCCDHIQQITERIAQSFTRRYDVMIPIKENIKYKDIPREIRVLGWCAFLHDQLREHIHGRYFKKRRDRYKQLKYIYTKHPMFN